jgi:hypothetical protein
MKKIGLSLIIGSLLSMNLMGNNINIKKFKGHEVKTQRIFKTFKIYRCPEMTIIQEKKSINSKEYIDSISTTIENDKTKNKINTKKMKDGYDEIISICLDKEKKIKVKFKTTIYKPIIK